MYEAPPLENWTLFYLDSEENMANRFVNSLNESLTMFNYHAKEIKMIKVKSKNVDEWINLFKENLSVHVMASIIIIPGIKGHPNFLYDHIKRYLL
jgi:hypothetical protein